MLTKSALRRRVTLPYQSFVKLSRTPEVTHLVGIFRELPLHCDNRHPG